MSNVSQNSCDNPGLLGNNPGLLTNSPNLSNAVLIKVQKIKVLLQFVE